ncbi:hypothetical protein [Daejeonella sp. H1SJ63]|uniref:hypothetical protein n=1 Tax=Daejeonella sp. H1SJ63 TaxID=3034145 RepID=UPI0023EC1B0A|nr:hypothetical protein [Daejeonella sp. H1SJ63]
MNAKNTRGGYRPGSGRKKKVDELDKLKLIDEAVQPEHWIALFKSLIIKAIKEGDVKSAQLLIDSRFGRAHQTMDPVMLELTKQKGIQTITAQEVTKTLVFANTTLTEKDLEEIRAIEMGLPFSTIKPSPEPDET